MIKRTVILDVCCPKCGSGEIEFNNEPAMLVGVKPEYWPERVKPRGWYCFDCKFKFTQAARKPWEAHPKPVLVRRSALDLVGSVGVARKFGVNRA